MNTESHFEINERIVRPIALTLFGFLVSVLAPSQHLFLLIMGGGIVWAASLLLETYDREPAGKPRTSSLMETFGNLLMVTAAAIINLLYMPTGHKSGPMEYWVSNSTAIAAYTAPYVLPVLLLGLFAILLHGAHVMSSKPGGVFFNSTSEFSKTRKSN